MMGWMMSQKKEDMKRKTIKPFNRSELIKIKATLERTGSITDRLLFSLMLTGMRPSEYLPIRSQDLILGLEKTFNFRGLSMPKADVDSALEMLSLRNTSRNYYIFPSRSTSNSPMKYKELCNKLVSWLNAANVSHDERSPHTVRCSVIIANSEAVVKLPKRFKLSTGMTSLNTIQNFIPKKHPHQN